MVLPWMEYVKRQGWAPSPAVSTSSYAERTEALAPFLNEYNHERPHSSLGNKTPASRVPIATYRLQPQPEVLDVPQVEGLGHEPTLFDLL